MSFLAELKRRNVIRVLIAYLAAAWFLIQIADTVVPAYGLPDALVGILITVLAIGLIPVVIISWAFEWTPAGLRRDADVAPGESIAPQTGRKLDRIIIVVLALAVGFFAFDKFLLDPARDDTREEQVAAQARSDALIDSYGDKSIVVLPFVNMSSDPEQGYFSDGITEEILNLLARIRELRVVSRSTAFGYRGEVNILNVAEELGVTYVLEGSVRRSGEQIRVTAQLIDGRTDTHVWSETWDRTGNNIFAIQDEVAAVVAAALHVELERSRAPRHETDPETYALFLQARHIFYGYSPMDQDRNIPIKMLRTVLDRDPDFVPAMLLMGDVIWYESRSGEYSPEEASAIRQEGRDLLRRAISIAPNDPVANAYMGWASIAREHDAQAAARYVQRALELDPTHLEVLRVAANVAEILQLDVSRIELHSRTLTRDVLCASCLTNLSEAYLDSGNEEAALELMQRRIDLIGDEAAYYQVAYHQMDIDPAAALEFFEARPEHGASALGPQVKILHDLGRKDEAMQVQQRLVNEYGDHANINIAINFAILGDVASSWEWLERALQEDKEVFVFVYDGSRFPGLGDTPRWKELRRQMGLSEEQLAAVQFELPDLGPGPR